MNAQARSRLLEFDDLSLSAAENVVGFPGEKHRAVLSEPRHQWAGEVISQIEGHLRLPSGWDGHNAPQLKLETVLFAVRVLSAVCKSNTPAPTVVPTTMGGLQFEWHRVDLNVEINVRAAAQVEFFADDSSGDVVERELTVDFRPVVPWIDRLS